jgi:hypothetical protein
MIDPVSRKFDAEALSAIGDDGNFAFTLPSHLPSLSSFLF